jgi:chloride channel protein, CIC family
MKKLSIPNIFRNGGYAEEHGKLFLASIAIGLVGGFGAIAFRLMLQASEYLFFDKLLPLISFHVGSYNLGLILLPAVGGLIVGPLIYRFAREAKGHGVPEVIEAVHRKQGLIRPVVALVKILASSVTIGSGGSAGREGPIAQIGAVFGSLVGRLAFASPQHRKLLVSCGVAAGISATFHAPLGGAVFAMEVISVQTGLVSAIPVLVAAVIGDVVMAGFFGFEPAFAAPAYTFSAVSEVPVFVVVGVVFGLLSYVWSTCFYAIERRFDALATPEWFKPVLGGLVVGLFGMFLVDYGIMGVGYQDIQAAMAGTLPLQILLVLGVVKILATSFSIGAGGSGGIFAPTLYIGSMFGAAIGIVANRALPGVVHEPHAYTLIGMGALFAGIGRAPVTALIMIPEMTNNYLLLIPMVIVSALSYLVASTLTKSSMYLMKLEHRGVKIRFRENVLEGVVVRDVMTKQPITLSPRMKLSDVSLLLTREHHPAFPVVDDSGAFVGVLTIYDLHSVSSDDYNTTRVQKVMHTDYPHVRATNSAYHALRIMVRHNLGRIPVIEHRNGGRGIVGIISKTDVVSAYARMME